MKKGKFTILSVESDLTEWKYYYEISQLLTRESFWLFDSTFSSSFWPRSSFKCWNNEQEYVVEVAYAIMH